MVPNVDSVQIQMLLESYREQIKLLWQVGSVITTAETAVIVYLFKKLLECQNQITNEVRGRKAKEERVNAETP